MARWDLRSTLLVAASLAMLLGLLLWWMARPLGRRAARALDKFPDA